MLKAVQCYVTYKLRNVYNIIDRNYLPKQFTLTDPIVWLLNEKTYYIHEIYTLFNSTVHLSVSIKGKYCYH